MEGPPVGPECTSDPEAALSRRCQFLRRVTPRGRVTILEAGRRGRPYAEWHSRGCPMKTRAVAATLTLAVLLSGCAAVPPGASYPLPSAPATARVAHVLHRAAAAAGGGPTRSGLAFV